MATPNDTTHDATEHDTQGDSGRQVLTIAEASKHFGVNVRTIQRRLDNGTLSATFRDGKRYVVIGGDTRQGDTTEGDSATFHAQKATEGDTTGDRGGEGAAVPNMEKSTASQPSREDEYRDEIRFLRGLVEQRDRDAAELRAALRKALEVMPKALPQGEPQAAAPEPVVEQLGQVGTENSEPKLIALERGATGFGDPFEQVRTGTEQQPKGEGEAKNLPNSIDGQQGAEKAPEGETVKEESKGPQNAPGRNKEPTTEVSRSGFWARMFKR